jgi:hypothetical protein
MNRRRLPLNAFASHSARHYHAPPQASLRRNDTSTESMLRDDCGHVSTSRSIPTAMAGVMFGCPRGTHRSQIVRPPASNESAYRDHGDHHSAADDPENGC